MAFDIFGIENGCIDLNVCIDSYPEKNRGQRVRDMTWQGGGKVSTGMATAARLGASCTLCACFAKDAYGRFLYKDFLDHGVDLTGSLFREDGTTSMSVVVSESETSTRNIFFKPGNLGRMESADVRWDLLMDAKYLYISQTRDPCIRDAMRIAREHGVKVFIDADFQESLRENIPYIDVFVGSEYCFDSFFPGAKEKGLENLEEEVQTVRDMGPETVLFTFGERGLIGKSRENGYFTVPAFKVNAIDTVGAGDVFHGAYVAALVEGKDAKEAAVMASATSAIKCTRIGGRAGIPDRKILEKFLATGEIDGEELDRRAEHYRRAMDYV
ncbi:MAG: carbohydrate kinase family protein [Lachnospiraceae bacterium]|nr:carbohydrate kinase family protein [Lachnospiraceae bacterium]